MTKRFQQDQQPQEEQEQDWVECVVSCFNCYSFSSSASHFSFHFESIFRAIYVTLSQSAPFLHDHPVWVCEHLWLHINVSLLADLKCIGLDKFQRNRMWWRRIFKKLCCLIITRNVSRVFQDISHSNINTISLITIRRLMERRRKDDNVHKKATTSINCANNIMLFKSRLVLLSESAPNRIKTGYALE